MRFEQRELKPYAEPVATSELKPGSTYFAVQFLDDGLLVPEMEALVFLGSNLHAGDTDSLYFQDAGSYRDGIRWQSATEENSVIYTQADGETNHIFEFERALDVLMNCSLRRASKMR